MSIRTTETNRQEGDEQEEKWPGLHAIDLLNDNSEEVHWSKLYSLHASAAHFRQTHHYCYQVGTPIAGRLGGATLSFLICHTVVKKK